MSRHFRHKGADNCAKGPVDYLAALPYREEPDFWDLYHQGQAESEYAAVRKFSAYKPGDIIYIREGDRIRLVKIYCVMVDYLEQRGEYIPRYRVQFATKAGEWSKQWRDTWPGFIERAYKGDKFDQEFTLAYLEELAKS